MPTTYEAIATVTVGSGGAATISFNAIPATFTDLKLVISSRFDSGAVDITTQFNSSGGTAYSMRRIKSNPAAGVSSDNTVSASNITHGLLASYSSTTANTFGNSEVYITNYTSANNKAASFDATMENNATDSWMSFVAGLWANTAAISSITLTPSSGNFVQHTTAYLYGIKNS